MHDSFKRTRLWSSLSLAALVGSGASVAANLDEPGAVAGMPAPHEAMSLAMEGEGGEGEGEGGGVPANPVTSDSVYLTRLGLMRGHLLVGLELFREGQLEQARTHMKHPRSELYAGLEAAFEARAATGFADSLTQLGEAVAAKQPDFASVEAAYAEVLEGIAAAEAVVDDSARGSLMVVVNLVRTAAQEYALGVDEQGRVVNGHEYQDAFGFVTVARQRLAAIDAGGKEEIAETLKKVDGYIAALFEANAWPSVMPPDRVEVEPSLLFGTAARIEIAMLGL